MVLLVILQAAYLVGISDPNSQAGHQGLVDPIQFARANQAIQMACQNLVDPGSSPSQVTKEGCGACDLLGLSTMRDGNEQRILCFQGLQTQMTAAVQIIIVHISYLLL